MAPLLSAVLKNIAEQVVYACICKWHSPYVPAGEELAWLALMSTPVCVTFQLVKRNSNNLENARCQGGQNSNVQKGAAIFPEKELSFLCNAWRQTPWDGEVINAAGTCSLPFSQRFWTTLTCLSKFRICTSVISYPDLTLLAVGDLGSRLANPYPV